MADGSGVDVARYEISSPALLARTPAVPGLDRFKLVDTGWWAMRDYLEQRLGGLKSWRLTWWQHWALLAENILPRRYHWLITPNTMNRGVQLNQSILDPTGTQAMRICAAGMMNGLTAIDRPWFKLKPGISGFVVDADGQAWFDEVEYRVYAVMAGSNFYDAVNQLFEDLVVFGTGPMIIYEDRRDIIRCYNPCAGEYYLAAGADGRVESLYRTFTQTTAQLVSWFGIENVGTEVKGMWAQKGNALETEQVVAHAIEPNFSAGQTGQSPTLGVVPGGYPYREVYWLLGKATQSPLSVRGFRDPPFIAPRWATTSNDAYGRSPGMDALPDILQLQRMAARLAEGIEKQLRPPMQADVSLKNEPASTLPGGITFVTNVEKGGMRPIYEIEPPVQAMAGLIEKIQTRVQRWFFNDMFLMISQMEGVQPRNQMEISERRGEKLQVLGPVITKFQNEGASPAIARIISIMGRRSLLPPKPPSLQGVPLDIEYESINTIAQRASATAGMERTLMMAGRMEGVFQGTVDNINNDAFIRDYGDKLSFPTKDWNPADHVARIRAHRQQMIEEQMQSQAATSVLPAAVTAAKNLSQTPVGGGLSALQLMLNGGQQ